MYVHVCLQGILFNHFIIIIIIIIFIIIKIVIKYNTNNN